jgi:PKHD-type hydroxylase
VLLRIPGVLTAVQAAEFRAALDGAAWADGRNSAGYLSQAVKSNEQLADTDPTARRLGDLLIVALEKNGLFTSAALPLKVMPPLFNRYTVGQTYGAHVDGAIRPVAGTAHRVRTDLSATLFLCDPESYDGGELVVREGGNDQGVKLAAGDMVLYPGSSVHRVAPVTRGVRLAAFFWVQSMVRDATQRGVLLDLDTAIQRLARDVPGNPALVDLAGVYHNLLRVWADA